VVAPAVREYALRAAACETYGHSHAERFVSLSYGGSWSEFVALGSHPSASFRALVVRPRARLAFIFSLTPHPIVLITHPRKTVALRARARAPAVSISLSLSLPRRWKTTFEVISLERASRRYLVKATLKSRAQIVSPRINDDAGRVTERERENEGASALRGDIASSFARPRCALDIQG